MSLSKQEFEALLNASAEERYCYWVRHVADLEEVWSLAGEDGWLLVAEDDGREAVPVWSHSEYAEACKVGSWERKHPRSIALGDWIGRWLPAMDVDERLVSVFPTPTVKGVSVSPDRVEQDLKQELQRS